MPSDGKRRAAPPLLGLRSPIRASTSRIAAIVSVAVLFVAWCVLSYVHVQRNGESVPLVPHFFLPAPDEVLKALLFLIVQENLIGELGLSALRIIKAFGISLAIAIPLGLAMGSFELINRIFDPIIAPMRYLPITAFVPLLILWFGINGTEKVAFLVLGTAVYLLPTVVDAIRAVPEELVQTAFTLGATKAQVIRTVLIPAALPQIFDSFRVMNAIAWTYIILAETIAVQQDARGIGALLKEAGDHYKPDWIFAGIVAVGIIGIATDLLIRGMNRLLFSWREVDV